MLATAAVFATVACQKGITESGEFTPMTINAVSEGIATKVEMAYRYDLLWQESDKILVTDGNASDSFTLSSGAGTVEGTFTQDNAVSFGDEVEAFYPSSIVSGTSLVWPAEQTETTAVPMYSRKTLGGGDSETFNFQSLGAVLQIVFNSFDNVKLQSIEIKDGTKTMSGAFHVDAAGKAVIDAADNAGITLDLGKGKSLGKGANYFNICIPAGFYNNLSLVFTDTNGRTCKFTDGSIYLRHNNVGRLTLTGEKFVMDMSKAILPGVFSVSETKKVKFSKSCLVWNGRSFDFEDDQYVSNMNTEWDPSHVIHFHWTKTASEAYAERLYGTSDMLFTNSTEDTPDANFTVAGIKGKFRTLSGDEWQYLFNPARMVYGKPCYTLSAFGYIVNKTVLPAGLYLYPDDYNGELVSSKDCTMEQLEKAGVVFLSFTCYRVLNVDIWDGHYQVGIFGGNSHIGNYWSSTPVSGESPQAACLSFHQGLTDPDDMWTTVMPDNRNNGHQIRLVTDIN